MLVTFTQTSGKTFKLACNTWDSISDLKSRLANEGIPVDLLLNFSRVNHPDKHSLAEYNISNGSIIDLQFRKDESLSGGFKLKLISLADSSRASKSTILQNPKVKEVYLGNSFISQ